MGEFLPEDESNPPSVTWNNLTDSQQRVAKSVAFVVGPGPFDRPTLETQAKRSGTIGSVVDDKERLMKSLQYTNLLNTLTEKGYLTKISQGGSPIVFDTRPEDDQSITAAPFGYVDQFQQLVEIVLDREEIDKTDLKTTDFSDVNGMVSAVNELVDGNALAITGEPSRYGLSISTSRVIIKNSLDDIETRWLQVSLFNQYPTIHYSDKRFALEATVESISNDVVNIVITNSDGYIDEAYVPARDSDFDFVVNDAFEVIFVSDEVVYLLWDSGRSEEVKAEVNEIIERFIQQLTPVDESRGNNV